MKEGTSIREHVLDMMMYFNIAEVNGNAIDKANQVSFISESLPKSFIPFQTNASLNKIEFNLTTLLNELQRFQNLTKDKGKEVEANVATTKRKFSRGSSSKSKAGPSKPNRKIEKKEKGKTSKQNKEKKTIEKSKCYHYGENGNWLRNCPKYLVQKKAEKKAQGLRAKTPLELVHSDLCGPMNVKARGDYEYFIRFIDDYSRYGHVYLIQNKSDSFEKFKEYKVEVENESGRTIKTLQSDRGEEYMDLRFQDYLIEHEIQSQLSAPSTPQQNGVSERRNQTLLAMPDRYLGLSEAQIAIPDDGIEDPLTYKQAMNDVDYDLKKWLATQFQMKDLGNAQYILGIQIVRNRKNKTLAMSQTSYIDKMLSRYKMQNFKKGQLPYKYGINLSKEQCLKTPQEVEDMSNIPYASAVGSLMYAMLCTRPNICYLVEMVSRYQSNPGCDHWTTIKNILKYLRRTKDYMLVYGSKDLILIEYTNSVFQSDKDARKSTSGLVFTLNRGAVVCSSL
ncbi:retrotransposon protein, putative, Ty1-copia subclass [Cucumis melo var. makuwa]|uniref:Retrotransposon protein, putative, Ty1-copia subclass n=1 Tax=Cucumis melo var. makuwa TaxID=1194695 RepID=A0A5D3BPJ0_CUCMM|nr:retrotransposon protein, putative, Ty1-copia subclass [Cucumis melo var. makuwa]